jgi:hypothetical protein
MSEVAQLLEGSFVLLIQTRTGTLVFQTWIGRRLNKSLLKSVNYWGACNYCSRTETPKWKIARSIPIGNNHERVQRLSLTVASAEGEEEIEECFNILTLTHKFPKLLFHFRPRCEKFARITLSANHEASRYVIFLPSFQVHLYNLSPVFSNDLNLCSPLKVRDQLQRWHLTIFWDPFL